MAAIVQIGEILSGKYRVERELGAGGMGVVVEATQLVLGRRVAIKVLSPEAFADDAARARLMREGRAAAQIRGEHVARVLDVGEHDGAPYIVMELLEGEDLGSWLQREGPLPVVEAVDSVLVTCAALAEAHVLGIVHRDLKPSNLFRARKPDGTVVLKVLDFGVSKLDEPGCPVITQSNAGVGTPLYMSPEQIRDARSTDVRSDVWSLGVVLYELCTAVPPFEGASVTAVSARILESDPEPISVLRPDVPKEVAEVVARCLLKARDERYADVAALADALAPYGSDAGRASAESARRLLYGSGHTMKTPRAARAATQATSATASAWARVAATSKQRAAPIAVAALVVATLGAWLVLRDTGMPDPASAGPAVTAHAQDESTLAPSSAVVPQPSVPPSAATPLAQASTTATSFASASTSAPPRVRAPRSPKKQDNPLEMELQ